jgi:hypothetical protein
MELESFVLESLVLESLVLESLAPETVALEASTARRRRFRCALALAGGMLLAQGAAAQFLYVCTVNGHTYTNQQPPQECKNVDIRELNPDGTLHHLIPAPLTREQLAKKREEDEARLREEETARAQQRRERSLLEAYSSVDEIEAARKRSLTGQQALIDRADARLAQLKKEKTHLDNEAEFYVNRDMPPKLKEQFATNQTLADQQLKAKASAQAEMARINDRFDGDRKLFEDIERRTAADQEARRRATEEMQQQEQQQQ